MTTENSTEPILQVKELTMHYQTRQGAVKAVDGISFDLARGEVLGLVGESGCGKTSVAISFMKLLPDNARVIKGQVLLDGQDLLTMDDGTLRDYRWRRISMIFQAAMNSLDPVHRVGDQIIEALDAHDMFTTIAEARETVDRVFRLVGLDPRLTGQYPHEFSGGMRQRAVIAMALACQPDVVIADEPTTALDVIVQDRILRQIKEIQRDLNMSIIYITHDIAVVAEVTDRIGVMYAGKLVELGSTAQVFNSPIHPYTKALLSVFPSIRGGKRPLATLGGEPPNLVDPPSGCRFHPRCPYATDICQREEPPVVDRDGHWANCWNPVT
ncbi:MAG: ABC transporter ATP-binding protein [Chloroflexota bacterium]|nr:ABC transporter ATP-binding protein [Chloroflexota bacterium]